MSLTRDIYLCMALKMLSKIHVLVCFYPWYRWRNQRQTQYRNCHFEQFRSQRQSQSHAKGGEMSWNCTNSSGPFPPQRETYYTSFTDIWWFYRLKQLVKLSKPTQFCLPFCKVLNICCITLAKIMYKLTSVLTSYVSIISDKLLCKILLSDK